MRRWAGAGIVLKGGVLEMDNSTAVMVSAGAAIVGGVLGGLRALTSTGVIYEQPKLQIDYEGKDGVNKVEVDMRWAKHMCQKYTSGREFKIRDCG